MKELRICDQGHRYFKSSDCPTCPQCEAARRPKDGFLALLAAPARRALEREGIDSLEILSQIKEEEILTFHGIGQNALNKLKSVLAAHDLNFRE